MKKLSRFLPMSFKMYVASLPAKIKLAKEIFSKGGVISYSQNGEDIIVREIFNTLNIKTPSYIDVGAHHPFNLSNTAIFNLNGSHGVNIEPNPVLFKRIAKYRKHDVNLQIGIGAANEPLTFYVASYPTVSTFSKEEADFACKQWGVEIVREIPVEVRTLNFVIEEYCGGVFPDFLSLDTEGLDAIILQELGSMSSLPKVICSELNDAHDGTRGTVREGLEILRPLGYSLVMRTEVNAIFVLKDLWDEAINK